MSLTLIVKPFLSYVNGAFLSRATCQLTNQGSRAAVRNSRCELDQNTVTTVVESYLVGGHHVELF